MLPSACGGSAKNRARGDEARDHIGDPRSRLHVCERATMTTAPRNGSAGPGFEEPKLLAFLDAIPAWVAFINRERRQL